MPSGICRAKGRRSSRKQGYYTQQFTRTAINKSTQAMKRKRKAEYWAKCKTDAAE
jgi:hypothetical protein